MRSTTARIAGLAVPTVLAFLGVGAPAGSAHWAQTEKPPPGAPIPAVQVSFHLTADREDRVPIKGGKPGTAGRTAGYWGRLTSMDYKASGSYNLSGSYQATCVGLANRVWGNHPERGDRDNRMSCTVVMSFSANPAPPAAPNGGSLVVQGLVVRPPDKDTLFKHSSTRKLAVVGGTGRFLGRRGSLDLAGAPHDIKVSLLSAIPPPGP
jgi:hypothetical protein